MKRFRFTKLKIYQYDLLSMESLFPCQYLFDLKDFFHIRFFEFLISKVIFHHMQNKITYH